MCTPFTHTACKALINNNIRLPINFLLVRPHMNYLMEMCAILSTGIEALGFTAVAGRDYTYGFTTLTKEMNANLSFWANCIITQPQNVRILRNLVSDGYGPGGGVGWFEPSSYNPQKLGDHVTPRGNQSSRSLMSLAIPFTEHVTRTWISVSGKLQHLEEQGHGGSTALRGVRHGIDDVYHFKTAERYNLIWRWRDQQDSNLMETLGSNGEFPVFNKICYQGHTLYTGLAKKGHPNGKFTYYIENKGHWGRDVGPGCQAVYSGVPKMLKTQDYTPYGTPTC
jgi:hypothetical protein